MNNQKDFQVTVDPLEGKTTSDEKTEDESEATSTPSNSKKQIEFSFEPGELKFMKFLFLMLGTTGFINWQTTTNCFQTIFATIYGNPSGANMILIPFLIGAVMISSIRIYFKTISLKISFLGIFLLFTTNLSIPIVVQFAPIESAPIILHVLTFFVGTGVGSIQGNLSVYAFLMPYNLFGLLFTGGGLAGLLAFTTWQALIRIFFDSSIVEQLKVAVWIYYGISVCCILILLVLFLHLIRKPWFKGSIKIFNDSRHVKIESQKSSKLNSSFELKLANSTEVGMRSYKSMFQSSLPFILMSSLSLGIHATVFPNIGPYGWENSYDNRSLLVGIFQSCEFLGRFTPYLGGQRFIIPIKLATILIFSRIIFIPIAILMGISDGPLASNFTIQLFLSIIFAFSSGYLTIIPNLGVGRGLVSVAERGFMGMLNFLITQSTLGLGILLSNLMITIIDIQA